MPECRTDTRTRNLVVDALVLELDYSSDSASETVCGGDDRGDGGNGDGGNGGGGNDGDGGNGGDGEPDDDDAKTWTLPAHLAGSRCSAPSSDLAHLHHLLGPCP